MTKEQFDNYRFSINTEILYLTDKYGEMWKKVTEVNFGDRWVGVDGGQYLKYSEINGIKN